jgi:hypothetical protein
MDSLWYYYKRSFFAFFLSLLKAVTIMDLVIYCDYHKLPALSLKASFDPLTNN